MQHGEKLARFIIVNDGSVGEGALSLSSFDDREIFVLDAFSVDLLKVVSQFSMQSILICMKLTNAGKF